MSFVLVTDMYQILYAVTIPERLGVTCSPRFFDLMVDQDNLVRSRLDFGLPLRTEHPFELLIFVLIAFLIFVRSLVAPQAA